jgi:uncharacterized delta-60 repeat protein
MQQMLGKWLIAFIAILAIKAQAQGWVSRYDDYHLDDYAPAIAVDRSGNVYVTGSVYDSSRSEDYLTIKYSSSGSAVWMARYENDSLAPEQDKAFALAIDSSGNVYVTGKSRMAGHAEDCVTIKYNSNGEQVWLARYDGSIHNSDEAFAIAVDRQGNVYITGWSSDPTLAYLTVKYDSSGREQWHARYDGPDYEDQAKALTVDAQGNVYVTGYSRDVYGPNYATIKYDPNGSELWVRRYNGPADDDDVARAIALDQEGNVYVTGYSYYSFYPPYSSYTTIKYSPIGEQLWLRRYDGPVGALNEAHAMALDGDGNIYLTGRTMGSSSSWDYTTLKYNSAGDLIWEARYDNGDEDIANAIAVDSAGYVYVTGESEGISNYDYATVKYNPAGGQEWVIRYNNSPGYGDDRAQAIAVDNSGNAYVTGWSTGFGTAFDYATMKCPNTGIVENPEIENQSSRLEAEPNPFVRSTTIRYYLPNETNISLGIYDISGKLVRVVRSGIQEQGYHQVELNSTHLGSPLQTGIYFVRLETASIKLVRKILLSQ